MPFTFKHLVISGTRSDTQGPSKFIQEARIFLEDAGWVMVDDRTSQAGSVNPALTHKMVFSSNGEAGNFPTFYLTIFSGTGAGSALADNPFLMHTAYDLGSNTVPASGAVTHPSASLPAGNTLTMGVNVNTEVWMSGDSNGVAFVTSEIGSPNFDSMAVGKAQVFNPPEIEPYGLYVQGSNNTSISVGNSQGGRVIAGNPPLSSKTGTGDYSFLRIILGSTNQPYDIGSANSIYYAAPLVAFADVTATERGAIGMLQNVWESAGTNGGMLQQATLTASGVGGVRTYLSFSAGTTASLIIRQS